MRLSTIWLTVICGIVAFSFAGCGAGAKVPHPVVVPAAGVVKYKNEPVEGATVLFLSADSKKNFWGCSGKTDANGGFEITSAFSPTTQDQGVPPGNYTVIVTKVEPTAEKSIEEIDAEKKEFEAQAMKLAASGGNVSTLQHKAHSLVPEKYNSEVTSGLKVNIEPEGNTTIELNLAD